MTRPESQSNPIIINQDESLYRSLSKQGTLLVFNPSHSDLLRDNPLIKPENFIQVEYEGKQVSILRLTPEEATVILNGKQSPDSQDVLSAISQQARTTSAVSAYANVLEWQARLKKPTDSKKMEKLVNRVHRNAEVLADAIDQQPLYAQIYKITHNMDTSVSEAFNTHMQNELYKDADEARPYNWIEKQAVVAQIVAELPTLNQ